MTDALWNGIIGAGGAAICCAGYFLGKFLISHMRKIKFSRPTTSAPTSTLTHDVPMKINNQGKTFSITIPPKEWIFTKSNIRGFGLVIIGVLWCNATEFFPLISANPDGYRSENYQVPFDISLNLSYISASTGQTTLLLNEALDRAFYLIGATLILFGLTSLSFKKK